MRFRLAVIIPFRHIDRQRVKAAGQPFKRGLARCAAGLRVRAGITWNECALLRRSGVVDGGAGVVGEAAAAQGIAEE